MCFRTYTVLLGFDLDEAGKPFLTDLVGLCRYFLSISVVWAALEVAIDNVEHNMSCVASTYFQSNPISKGKWKAKVFLWVKLF